MQNLFRHLIRNTRYNTGEILKQLQDDRTKSYTDKRSIKWVETHSYKMPRAYCSLKNILTRGVASEHFVATDFNPLPLKYKPTKKPLRFVERLSIKKEI